LDFNASTNIPFENSNQVFTVTIEEMNRIHQLYEEHGTTNHEELPENILIDCYPVYVDREDQYKIYHKINHSNVVQFPLRQVRWLWVGNN
jgi:hypothetical protein